MADLRIVRFLLTDPRAAARGGDRFPIDAPSIQQDRFTLLHAAVAVRSEDKSLAEVAAVVEFLLERGADPLIQDKNGKTPADHARRQRGLKDVVRLLEEAASKGARAEAVRGLMTWVG